MNKFLFGFILGIIFSTVGFNGIANLGNRTVSTIQSFASENLK